jgi:exonuclease SbcC
MTRIAHIADTHIHNFRYHKEYKKVFEMIYTSLRKEQPDLIVHCGDIAHTKTQISPEYIDTCKDFLEGLANIAPLVVILGNHDGNLKNLSRQDAISPIISSLKTKNPVYFSRDTQTYKFDDVAIHAISVFDDAPWPEPSDKHINIALYHGCMSEAKTDLGFALSSEMNADEIFKAYDYTLLGDIHKKQFLGERIAYCGSTIQQNFGEVKNKGYLLWDIDSATDFTCDYRTFENPKAFETIIVEKDFDVSQISISNNSRVRLKIKKDLTIKEVEEIKIELRNKFDVESIIDIKEYFGNNITEDGEIEDLSSLDVQREHLESYLEPGLDKEVKKAVFEFAKRFHKEADYQKVFTGSTWNLNSLDWSNLFSYGEDNEIDFKSYEGIVGIFGKNYTGKSSIVDSLLYTIFNSNSKGIRKTYDVINNAKTSCSGEVSIEAGGQNIKILRKTEKKDRKDKSGNILNETKSTLTVTRDGKTLNELSKRDTDKLLSRMFGTKDDFLLTTLSSQSDPFNFISQGNTVRREILSRFLGLDAFEPVHKLAKKELNLAKKQVNKYNLEDLNTSIKSLKDESLRKEALFLSKKNENDKRAKDIEELSHDIIKINAGMKPVPKLLNRKELNRQLRVAKEYQKNLENAVKKYRIYIDSWKDEIADSKTTMDSIDVINLNNVLLEHETSELELKAARVKLDKALVDQANIVKDKTILCGVPCDKKLHSSCKFVKNASNNVAKTSEVEESIIRLEALISEIEEKKQKLDSQEGAKSSLELRKSLFSCINDTNARIRTEHLVIESKEKDIKASALEQERIKEQLAELTANEESILFNEEISSKVEALEKTLKILKMTQTDNEIISISRELARIEVRIETEEANLETYEKLSQESKALEIYSAATHSTGIPLLLIKKHLSLINQRINEALSTIVDFTCNFVIDGPNLEIKIKHPGQVERSIESGSGAEKTLASMAIRIALTSLTKIAKPNMLILDEPAVALDKDNMLKFSDLLTMLKDYFKIILLITHVDELKDVVDTVINVNKNSEGFATLT